MLPGPGSSKQVSALDFKYSRKFRASMSFHLLDFLSGLVPPPLPPPNFFHQPPPPTTTCSFCCIYQIGFALVLIFLQYKFQLLVVSGSFQGFLDLIPSVSYLLKRRLLIKKGLWLLSLSDWWLENNLFRSVALQLVGILVIRETARVWRACWNISTCDRWITWSESKVWSPKDVLMHVWAVGSTSCFFLWWSHSGSCALVEVLGQ